GCRAGPPRAGEGGLGDPGEPSGPGPRRWGWRRTAVTDSTVAKLRSEVVEPLKRRFVGRDEVVDLIALAVVAGEHLFLYGPPGTAKSLLVRRFAGAVRCRYFEYLLTRFSEPNELFGPVHLVKFRPALVPPVTTRILP